MYTAPVGYPSRLHRTEKNGTCSIMPAKYRMMRRAHPTPSPRLQKIDWDQNGMPVLGTPQKKEEPMAKPSGSPMNQKQD